MKKITLLDTSIATENIGDKIIMSSIWQVINTIFPECFYVCVPTHDVIRKQSYAHMNTSDYRFCCGTNLLSSNMDRYNQWKVNIVDSFYTGDIILMGVGWWQYQKKPNTYTKYLLKRLLSKNGIHSVRDNYTKSQLESIGIVNVINTSCPTMWELTPQFCADIPSEKGNDVLLTLTDYNKNPVLDKNLIEILLKNYRNIYFWIQSFNDLNYIKSLGFLEKIILVPPTLSSLDSVLEMNSSLDYVGTRLHAGIRALNFKKRSIIIGIDNRALEKAIDFNVTVVKREDIDPQLTAIINKPLYTNIKIPIENIRKWQQQF